MGNQLYAIAYESLPIEAKRVLLRIANNLPIVHLHEDQQHKFKQDWTPFMNHFGNLPTSKNSEYFEFTVLPPKPKKKKGKLLRGVRRLVIRKNGIVFFTACHYERFKGGRDPEVKKQQVTATQHLDPKWRNGFYVVTGIDSNMRRMLACRMRSHGRQCSNLTFDGPSTQ